MRRRECQVIGGGGWGKSVCPLSEGLVGQQICQFIYRGVGGSKGVSIYNVLNKGWMGQRECQFIYRGVGVA